MTTKLRPVPVFGGHDAHNGEQHRLLGLALDPFTTRHLARTGVRPGWRCLEVGAGDGGVAAWLARRVSPTGSVLATDIGPVPMPVVEGLEFVVHDIVHDPLPEAGFDLVHARLVLRLLPERLAVLDRLVRALKPGGVLQIDEFDATDAPALSVPDPAAHDLYRTFLDAKAQIMTAGNVDIAWGRKAASAMRRAGLTGVPSPCRYETWCAGSPGLELLGHHTRHLRDRFVRIRVSQINGCAFCLSLHTRAALDAGDSETRLDELASWRESTLFTAAERAALALAEAMTSARARPVSRTRSSPPPASTSPRPRSPTSCGRSPPSTPGTASV